MRSLRGIFDELIAAALSPKIPMTLVHWISRMCLRRLYSDEETDELRGISAVTDIDLYLLVCLNTVLDLLMGCTSGGVRTIQSESTKTWSTTKMLHFRTLDWAMDPLRDLIVQLDFYRDDIEEKVLASSITYVGFVGVLTGVRRDLSVSLNFRPVHDTTKNWTFYANHLLVLLGMRQSISSLLRECILLPPGRLGTSSTPEKSKLSTLDDIVANVPGMPTTAAYLIFSDGDRTVTMEKDYRKAAVCSSSSFIVATNHDQQPDSAKSRGNHFGLSLISSDAQTVSDIIEESSERRACMQDKWDRKVAQRDSSYPPRVQGMRSSLRLRQRREHTANETCADVAITQNEAIEWLTTYPVLNESTHYAAIMDPTRGKVVWAKLYNI
ncbi:uncharacterized protein TRUGW13939_09599 [Talaromyces rugulosus]|uniref:ceramidase n=1 Tax=Talaromyces rugulosus TaxID=121627 RepID=A0A7H8R921_TALRU|nr:uncharacterized protein TRUGW13939_09599 [Talaromyces rugulosus]QKX62438.1 hypothetical protein TRUGW13939_09599 [Talaromyces rugulosus]